MQRSGSNALMKAAQYNSIKALRHLVLAPGLNPNMKQVPLSVLVSMGVRVMGGEGTLAHLTAVIW